MSRKDRRAVTLEEIRTKARGSILLELAERDVLTERQAEAARRLELDREASLGRSPGVQKYAPRTSTNSGGTVCPMFVRETDASLRLTNLKQSLPPSFRTLYGRIEQASWEKGLSGLKVYTGQKGAREDGLVKRGIVAAFLEACADFYGLPDAAEGA